MFKDIKCERTFKRNIDRLSKTDASPHHVAVGDFNRDGHTDIVVGNYASDNIAIHLNNGDGDFSHRIIYSLEIGSSPIWIAVNDFNNNIQLDIAVANYGSHCVEIYLDFNNENFSNQSTISFGSLRPVSLAVGNFNRDNRTDIAVVTNGTFNLILLFGFGDGSFKINAIYDMGYDTMPYSVAATDLNNDNQDDIVVVNYGTSNLVIFMSNDDGNFSKSIYSTGSNSHPCVVSFGNFNHDNYLDIAVINSANNTVGIFSGIGGGRFTSVALYSGQSTSHPQFLVTGDFNLNNLTNFIIADTGVNSITVVEQFSGGGYAFTYTHSMGANSKPYALAMGNFDNDNKPDVVVANSGTNSIVVLRSYSNFLSANQNKYSTGTLWFPNCLAVGDFNNDQILDIIVAGSFSNYIIFFFGYGDGDFIYQEAISLEGLSVTPYLVVVNDLNNDGNTDLVVTTYDNNQILIYLGRGNGDFYKKFIYATEVSSFPTSIILHDLNQDNIVDIVTANANDNTISVLLGHGDGTFANATNYSTGNSTSPIYATVGDFNNDGLVDLISANYDTDSLTIYFGNGYGIFSNQIFIFTSNYYANSLVVQDLNNDKDDDIIAIFSSSSSMGIFLGNGDGSFQQMKIYSTDVGSLPLFSFLADFNKDGMKDIAILDSDTPSINIFFGYNNGSFSKKPSIPIDSSSSSYFMASGDFNNDSEIDIVVSNLANDDITILLLRYQTDFANETFYSEGSLSRPLSVALGNFGQSHQSGIVVANSGTHTVQILFDYQQGTFMNKTTYKIADNSYPQYVAVADFDKDDQQDVAMIDSWNAALIIFLTVDNGIFDQKSVYSLESKSFPNSIGVGDFNKDSWIDVVVTNKNANNIAVYLGFDYPTFVSSKMTLHRRDSLAYSIGIGDFNNDFRLDMAIISYESNVISVIFGYGDGTYGNEQQLNIVTLKNPLCLVVDDFNNDTALDIAVTNRAVNYEDPTIYVLLGKGDGTFPEYTSFSTPGLHPVFMVTGDVNNDSRLDLVVLNLVDNYITILIGYGNGSFEKEILYSMDPSSYPSWAVISDFNNDNILDIAVADYGGNQMGIILGYGDGNFRNVIGYPTGEDSNPCTIDIGDFNSDSHTDIVVANKNGKNVAIFYGYGNGTFSLFTYYATGSTSMLYSIVVVDLNNDKLLDLVYSDWGNGIAVIGVFYGLGNGRFLPVNTYKLDINSQPTKIVIGDFNNDSRLDLAVANANKRFIYVMLRNKTHPLAQPTTFSTGVNSRPRSVIVSDFNSDNQLDIAVANSEMSNILIFLGDGNGNFAKQGYYLTGSSSNPVSLAIGDFNNDRRTDIVVVNANSSNICIFIGYANGSFTILETYSTGENSDPSSIAVADLNKDNQTDIVVTDSSTSNVLVFFGLGNGSLSTPDRYSLGYNSNPVSVAIGDINNDSWLDIVVANAGSDSIEILLQTC
ncbi:unnamed protein product [Rotaria sp. Silwood1]|nr:unnamed protein product [Rotaria sp. Silwood1]